MTARRDQPEKRIQLQIIQYLKLKGFAVGKIKTTGARRGDTFLKDIYHFRGLPDLIAFTPALVFIEVKAPGGRLSPVQKDFQEFCRHAGTPYIIAFSLDDIMRAFP